MPRLNTPTPHQLEPAQNPGQGQAATSPPHFASFQHWLLERLLKAAGSPAIKLKLANGIEAAPPGPTVATILIHDHATLVHLMLQPEMAFGDGYAAGRIDVQGDLCVLLEALYRAGQPGMSRLDQMRKRFMHRANSQRGSRHNIHHHYDIGNDFYKLWLDHQNVYTCAYFPEQHMTLEAAQIAKMDHVCRKLRIQPGDRVIEAGCGWGALAMHMATHYGADVRAYNISREQLAYARKRAADEGLSDRVQFIEDDYRNIKGQCDVFVSVGMLEHVGTSHYRQLGAVIDRCLPPAEGRGLIHTIARHRPICLSRWIEKRIFPGGDPPTLRQMMDIFEPYNFAVTDVENLRQHYALTLRHWLHRFEDAHDQVANMFDGSFVRTWRLYLAGSASAFTTGYMQLYQVLFTRYADNTGPWVRAV